jgi:hypothetical protein
MSDPSRTILKGMNLGRQLQFLTRTALLAVDRPGTHLVRRQIMKRREEVCLLSFKDKLSNQSDWCSSILVHLLQHVTALTLFHNCYHPWRLPVLHGVGQAAV